MVARVGLRTLPRAGLRSVRGFTLVEFMVAMALGLVIMLAVSEIFVNNSQARSEIERVSRQIENGRFALQLLTDEISNAGFFAESTGHEPIAEPEVCLTTAEHVRRSMALPVSGGSEVSTSDAPVCLRSTEDPEDFKDGGSYLVIRRASTCAVGSAGCDPFKSDSHHIQVAACQTNDSTVTDHVAGDVVIATAASDMNALTRVCSASVKASVYRYLSRIYYVDKSDVLRRAELEDGEYDSIPLVEGVERLYFEYGLDNGPGSDAGDGVADEYVDEAVDWEDWADVVSVRITLLARAVEATPGYVDGNTYDFPDESYEPSDGFKRQLYSTVVRVNNVAGRRE